MQFSIHLDSKQITRDPSTTSPDQSTRAFIRGDGEPIELLFTKGNDYGVAPIQLPGTAEIKFIAKRTTDFGGDPSVVYSGTHTYDADSKTYTLEPSFGDAQMAAVFVGALDVVEITSSLTLDASHKNKLLVSSGASDIVVTAPSSIFANADKVFVLRGDEGEVTIVAGSGVTLTDADAIGSGGIASHDIAQVLFSSASAATITEAAESSSVTLGGEITWRDAGVPTNKFSSVQFALTVANERFRGDEANPIALGDPDGYYTKTAADARYLQAPLDAADIGDGEIATAKLADSAVTAAKLASDAVTTAKILDANVTTAKLADDAVTSAKIADLAITSALLADSSVTTAKVADGAITAAKLAAGTRAVQVATPITATSYIFTLADADKLIPYNSSSAGTFVIPLNASVAFPIGSQITVWQKSSGRATIEIASGGTLQTYLGIATTRANGRLTVTKIATDEWRLESAPNERRATLVAGPTTITALAASGGQTVYTFYGDAETNYYFEMTGLYTSSVATESLGLSFVTGNAGISAQMAVAINTTAAGAVVCDTRSSAAGNLGTILQGLTSGAAAKLPFSIRGSFSIPAGLADAERYFRVRANVETGGSVVLQLYSINVFPIA